MNKTVSLLVIFLLWLSMSEAQTRADKPFEKKLDELLAGHFKSADPGCAILVASKGQVVYKKAFGNADIELSVPLQPDMVFKLGSITKQFTAVAILQLMEQGKLSLQDSLQQYIPDFPSKGYKITIENLLTHTSGIKDYLHIDFSSPFLERWDFTPKQLIDSFKNLPLEFEPGSKFSYSNSGYFLLGYLIEKISGRRFQTYIQENLLKPLDLSNTYFDSSNIIIPRRVKGYRKEGAYYRNADFWSMTIPYSAGGLISSVEDLFKWHSGLYSYKVLRKESLEKAFTPYKLKNGVSTGYGYGWFLKNIGSTRSIEHGGAISGFLSNEIYFPDEDIFITELFNCDCAPKEPLSVAISGIVLGKPLQSEVKVPDAILNSYTGVYTLVSDPKRTIVISKEKGSLVAKLSEREMLLLVFQSDTKFEFKNLLGVECEFNIEDNKVSGLTVNQNGIFVWKKTN